MSKVDETLPETSNIADGDPVPIPTLPAGDFVRGCICCIAQL
ncbi:hypothetical protein L915_07507 [Phytophthora nicotianae]|uniref:Uncharacterized protein n=1 Tax=Phytophthora nicotianae TaxID=4792 RepID=W2NHD7_PHYNI|nr:hypothetical protein L915_07507 [Phytophthora nicotianae]ETM48011.1 hypothetical protein L914_07401 [Phytophthora nicotianae]